MKIVMTIAVRNEADIIEENFRYHLGAGVDFIMATDHRSEDGTTEILERYERDGLLHLTRETGEAFLQTEWVTRMARLAATRLRRGLGHQRRCRRILVAAQRHVA